MTDRLTRESNGQFAKGNSGGPGRPRGAAKRESQRSTEVGAISASALPGRVPAYEGAVTGAGGERSSS